MTNNKGFTLLEMLVIIIIISVLAIVGKLSYDVAVEKAIASEIVPTVKAIQNAQLAYHAENRRYADSIFDLGLQLEGEKIHNFFPITSNTGSRGNGDAICTKYFVYSTFLLESRDDSGQITRRPVINFARRTAKEITFATAGIKYIDSYGATLDNIERPDTQMHYKEAAFNGNRARIYVFKKVLKSLIGNWHSHMDNY